MVITYSRAQSLASAPLTGPMWASVVRSVGFSSSGALRLLGPQIRELEDPDSSQSTTLKRQTLREG